MDSGGYAGEAFEEGGAGGVEELVGDAEDAAVADGAEVVPVALFDDAVEGDAVPCSAPGEEEDVGVGGGDGFGGGVGSGLAEVAASGGFDQFGYPVLGVDEGLAPLFAVDCRAVGGVCCAVRVCVDGALHVGDELVAGGLGVDVAAMRRMSL